MYAEVLLLQLVLKGGYSLLVHFHYLVFRLLSIGRGRFRRGRWSLRVGHLFGRLFLRRVLGDLSSSQVVVTAVVLLLVLGLLLYGTFSVSLCFVVDLFSIELLFALNPGLFEQLFLLLPAQCIEVLLSILRVHELEGTGQVWVALHIRKRHPHVIIGAKLSQVRLCLLTPAVRQSLIEHLLLPPIGLLVPQILIDLIPALISLNQNLLPDRIFPNRRRVEVGLGLALIRQLTLDVLELTGVSDVWLLTA